MLYFSIQNRVQGWTGKVSEAAGARCDKNLKVEGISGKETLKLPGSSGMSVTNLPQSMPTTSLAACARLRESFCAVTAYKKVEAMRIAMDRLVPAISAKKEGSIRSNNRMLL